MTKSPVFPGRMHSFTVRSRWLPSHAPIFGLWCLFYQPLIFFALIPQACQVNSLQYFDSPSTQNLKLVPTQWFQFLNTLFLPTVTFVMKFSHNPRKRRPYQYAYIKLISPSAASIEKRWTLQSFWSSFIDIGRPKKGKIPQLCKGSQEVQKSS